MKDLQLIKTQRYIDDRGFFVETFNKKRFKNFFKKTNFVQDNHSLSKKKGTLRGLHFQLPPKAQAKLVRCIRGAIYDVAVDIRKGSPTYGCWQGFEISEHNGDQLYIPIGFAHGFITLKDNTEVLYKCSDYYAPKKELSIIWNDISVGIDWPLHSSPILSEKDKKAPLLENINNPFIYGENS